MNTEEIAEILSKLMNEIEVGSYCPHGVRDSLRKFLNETTDPLSDKQREEVDRLAYLFLARPVDQSVINSNPQRFTRLPGVENLEIGVWGLALSISNQISNPTIGAFLDDLILENKVLKGPVGKIAGFDFKHHYERTISRYLEKINVLQSQKAVEGDQGISLAFADAVTRAAELCAIYGVSDSAKELLPYIQDEADRRELAREWSWLLPMVDSFVRLSSSNKLTGIVGDEDRRKFLSLALKCSEGFAEPGGLFHLIPDANALWKTLATQLGEANPEQEEMRKNLRMLEQVADHRAKHGERLAASHILNDVLILAHKLNDPSEIDRLSDKQALLRREAFIDGEVKESTVEYELTKDDWGRFIAPMVAEKTPEEALDVWIKYPEFLPDYKMLKASILQNKSFFSKLMNTVVIGGMGLQLADEGEGRSSEDLNVAIDVSLMVQFKAALFLAPSLEFLTKDLGVTPDLIKNKILNWKWLAPENKKAVLHGLDCHFSGDYVSSIHIMAPQFEGLLRRAFHLASVPGAISSHFSRKRGLQQQEKTLGKFLEEDPVKKTLGDKILTHFKFVFTDDPGDNLIGLNIRNKVAHGLIEPEMLNGVTSSLVLHCILLLTDLKLEENES